jgi:fused signal recognition particle receptor
MAGLMLMDSLIVILVISGIVIIGLAVGGAIAFLRDRGEDRLGSVPQPGIDYTPGVGDDASEPRDIPRKNIETLTSPSLDVEVDLADQAEIELNAPPTDLAQWELEIPEPSAGRLVRLRERLARSNNVFGKGLLAILSRESMDAEAWEDIEATLLGADLGVTATAELMADLKIRLTATGDSSPESVHQALKESLISLVDPNMDRTLAESTLGRPTVMLIVGVNGTGKTTTVGKLSRVLIADGRTVVLGAADTFRAAAAEQLQTWGDRVGAAVVRGPEGGDPASVAFEAVQIGKASGVDTVVIDTAGRLHTKTGLMDELGKVKRVIEKQSPVDEVLLVIDATTGQNGLIQAKVFGDVVNVTGIVLTKLDGTAKGGIVVAVQRELGVPVKLVGLGEGPDDLAPFDAEEFVSALIS